jgi:hypothetical protein
VRRIVYGEGCPPSSSSSVRPKEQSMSASRDTVRQIIDVLSRFIPSASKRRDLAAALAEEVRGNKSVMDTLSRLRDATNDDFYEEQR